MKERGNHVKVSDCLFAIRTHAFSGVTVGRFFEKFKSDRPLVLPDWRPVRLLCIELT